MKATVGPRQARGFSLVELMIGIALGLVILAALTSFFVQTSATRHEIERTSRQIENGRFAIDALRKEVHLAGFYAEIQQAGVTWTMADPCANALVNLGFALGPPEQIPLPITGYADGSPMPACVTDRVAGTDVLVIRRLNSEPIPVASVSPNQFYLQSSRCETDSSLTPWKVESGGAAGAFNLRRVNCGPFTDVYRYRVEIFYIRDYSATAGDGIPTLVKLELDPDAPTAVNGINALPLVEGIQNMRLEYGVDTDADGTPNEYRRCDTTTPCDVNQWTQVTTVRANLLAVNLEPTIGYKDEKIYDMGSGNPRTVGPFNDDRKRHVYSAVITAPNRTGPKES